MVSVGVGEVALGGGGGQGSPVLDAGVWGFWVLDGEVVGREVLGVELTGQGVVEEGVFSVAEFVAGCVRCRWTRFHFLCKKIFYMYVLIFD